MRDDTYDVAIIGGGPAGLSAALTLARVNRRVALFDAAQPRNRLAVALHGLYGLDGVSPDAVVRMGRLQLAAYSHVTCVQSRVTAVRRQAGQTRFQVVSEQGMADARRVIFATGLRDVLPAVDGLYELYGRSVFHCAYCHGWESRGRPWVFLGTGLEAIASVLVLRALNGQIVLCTNGTVSDNTTRELAHRIGLTIYDERIVGVASRKGELVSLSLDSGVELPCGALFLRPQVRQACDLLLELGCIDAPEQPLVPSADTGQTRVPGLFVAGDARLPWHQIAIAIADGMKVGMAVHTELAFEPYGLRP